MTTDTVYRSARSYYAEAQAAETQGDCCASECQSDWSDCELCEGCGAKYCSAHRVDLEVTESARIPYCYECALGVGRMMLASAVEHMDAEHVVVFVRSAQVTAEQAQREQDLWDAVCILRKLRGGE